MDKKGLGHIEFIFSMILFIGFVAAALYFLNPAKNTNLESSSIGYAVDGILGSTNANLTSYSVHLKSAQTGMISFDIPNAADGGAFAVNSQGVKITAAKSGGTFYVDAGAGTETFFTISISSAIEQKVLSGKHLTPGTEFEIATISSREVISEKAFSTLAEQYKTADGYATLKNAFNIPSTVDFSFSLAFSGTEKIDVSETKPIPSAAAVFADARRLEVLRNMGTEVQTQFADLSVKVW